LRKEAQSKQDVILVTGTSLATTAVCEKLHLEQRFLL